MEPNIRNIAVLTSGGDAPGMNACIRAVIRTGIYHGKNMFGVMQGYQGLIDNNIIPMDARSVSNILHMGGTILKTARCLAFREDEGMEKASITHSARFSSLRYMASLTLASFRQSFSSHSVSMEATRFSWLKSSS